MNSRNTALVLSDVYLFQAGVRSLLAAVGLYDHILVVDSHKAFEEVLQKQTPQVVILDTDSAVFRTEKVLAFVDFTTRANVVLFGDKFERKECDQLIERGAKGLMSKLSSESTLVKGLQQVSSKEVFVDEHLYVEEEMNTSMLQELRISTREKEIIKLIAQGLINKEIADRLFISTHTVNTHRKNIMAKLSINNTAGIVLFAVKEGIVSPNEFLFN